MSYPVPTSLSPSRVDAFTSCPMAFRFASVERLPEPPSVHATRGSLVHRALELLFTRTGPHRTLAAGLDSLDRAVTELVASGELAALALDTQAEQSFLDESEVLLRRYFDIEDPRTVRDIGIELRLSVEVGGLTLRGIIDRLELDDDGELVVTDYKTGRPPPPQHELKRLGGVMFYAYLCQQLFGRRPSQVRLVYLSTGEIITLRPSEQQVRFLPKRTTAVFAAVERACTTGEFRPNPGPLCRFCSFQRWCPEFGGDPSLARIELASPDAVPVPVAVPVAVAVSVAAPVAVPVAVPA